jgi:hypothetical protein
MAAQLDTTTAQKAFAFVSETLLITIVASMSVGIAIGCALL